jgi:hypothetical protein
MALNDALVGKAVVGCPYCHQQRWYGHGACGRCGAFIPGAEPSPEELTESVRRMQEYDQRASDDSKGA